MENIYQMHVGNGNRVGFWGKRDSWSRQTALITSVGHKTEGPLEGKPPNLGNPKIKGRTGGGARLRYPAPVRLDNAARWSLQLVQLSRTLMAKSSFRL